MGINMTLWRVSICVSAREAVVPCLSLFKDCSSLHEPGKYCACMPQVIHFLKDPVLNQGNGHRGLKNGLILRAAAGLRK